MSDEIFHRYRERFNETVPTVYFTDEAEAAELAREALDAGAPLTHEEWLHGAGFDDEEIAEIESGERVI